MPRIVIVPQPPPPATDQKVEIQGVIFIQDFEGRALNPVHSLSGIYKQVNIGLTDVFHDYMNWYGASSYHQITLHDEVLDHKFWHRSDLNDWIEANMQGTVILQRQFQNGVGWRIGFTLAEDYARFTSWWGVVGLKGYFEFDIPEPTYNEIVQWLKDNLRSEYRVKRAGYGRQSGNLRAVIIIRDLTEAAAFKLIWHGIENRIAA
jgi:hypothetical protein